MRKHIKTLLLSYLLLVGAVFMMIKPLEVEASTERVTVTFWDTKLENQESIYYKFNTLELKTGYSLAEHGMEVGIPKIDVPSKKGRIFEGWYLDKECTQPWNYKTDIISGDMDLYAKYREYLTVTVDNDTDIEFTYLTNEMENFYEKGIDREGTDLKVGFETQENQRIYSYFDNIERTYREINSVQYDPNEDGYVNENALFRHQNDYINRDLLRMQLEEGVEYIPYSKINTHLMFNKITISEDARDKILSVVENEIINNHGKESDVYDYEILESFETKATITHYDWNSEVANQYDIDYVTTGNSYDIFFDMKDRVQHSDEMETKLFLVNISDIENIYIENEFSYFRSCLMEYKISKYAVVRAYENAPMIKYYDGDELLAEVQYEGNDTAFIEEPIKDGYSFDGWYEEGSAEVFSYENIENEDVVLFARWTDVDGNNIFNINFYDSNGNLESTVEVKEGDLVKEPKNPKKEGYKFMGWSAKTDSEELYDFSEPVTENISLHQVWNEGEAEEGFLKHLGTMLAEVIKKINVLIVIGLAAVFIILGIPMILAAIGRLVSIFNNHEDDDMGLEDKYVLVQRGFIKSKDNGFFLSLLNEALKKKEFNTWIVKVQEKVVNDQVTNDFKLRISKSFAKKHNGETLIIEIGNKSEEQYISVVIFAEDLDYKFSMEK